MRGGPVLEGGFVLVPFFLSTCFLLLAMLAHCHTTFEEMSRIPVVLFGPFSQRKKKLVITTQHERTAGSHPRGLGICVFWTNSVESEPGFSRNKLQHKSRVPLGVFAGS
jgi:hypothetical protein